MLTVPFLVQLAGVVGVVGYVSYRNGQAAINEVTRQLRSEVSLRTQETLISYLEAPQVINRINVEMLREGQLGLDNPDELARFFWDQTSLFDTFQVSAIYFGSETGEFLGMGFQADQTWQVGRVEAATGDRFHSYAIDDKGNPTELLEVGDPYDPRIRPWYEWSVSVGREAWTDIYLDFKEPRLKLTHAIPVFSSQGELQGVVGVDFVLTHVQQFLRDLTISESGEIFIIERSGLVVASSSLEEEPFLLDENGQVTERLAGDRSQVPLIRETTKYLQESLGDLQRVQESQQLSTRLVGERQFIQVTPLSDRQGINWLIVVVVPESDFMARIHANTRTTILLCLGALGITLIGGVITARWVGQPILTIHQAAQEFAQGRWNKNVQVDRADELGELATAFNHMANQLQTYFTTLEAQNQLMMEVNDRLQQSLEKESKLTEAAGRFVPNQFLRLLGYDSIAEVKLGDTVFQEMTILFCDIRDFTRLSEQMTPEENFCFINSFLSQMEPPIVRHRGLIDKYIGDAIMALFRETADDAIAASIEMLHALAAFNTNRQHDNLSPIRMGIGINTGALILGMVGSEKRIDGTVIGDAVNLASRVEKMTKRYRVPLLITEHTYMRLSDPHRYCLRMIDQVVPRGKSEQITIFEVFDADAPELRQAKQDMRSQFEQAVHLYNQAQVSDALAVFEDCLRRCPQDTVAQVYIQTCQRLLAEQTDAIAAPLDNADS